MNNSLNDPLIKELKFQLAKGHAHVMLDDALEGIPVGVRGIVPAGLPYSIWQVVEHLRICQWDILDFSRNPDYKAINWPDDYWPKERAPRDDAQWQNSLEQIKQDRQDFMDLLDKDGVDLFAPFPWGSGQTLIREALVIVDHNSYHTGEIIVLRRTLGAWK